MTASIISKADLRVIRGRAGDERLGAVARLDGPDRGEDVASSRLRRSRSPARRLWLSARRASSSSPATRIGVDRSPVAARSTDAAIASQRRHQVLGEQVREQDREDDDDGHREQQAGGPTFASVVGPRTARPIRTTASPKRMMGNTATPIRAA